MPNNWKTYKLGEIADVQNGYAFKAAELVGSGTPIIKIKNIISPNVSIEDVSYYNGNITSQLEKYIAKQGDFLISMTGSTVNVMSSAVGKMGRYRINNVSLINQRVGKIYVTKPEIVSFEYLCQYLNRYEIHYSLALNATGSANQANISPAQIKDIDISLPSLTEQQSIASILSAIDEKIENNLAINKTLEEMAMALYKHRFVNFGPFQDGEFVESELGMIPKGWEVKSLENIGDFKNGKGIHASKRSEDGKYIILGSNGIIGKTNEIMFKEPVIAIGRVGANYGEVHYSIEPCWISDNAITVQPQIKNHYWFIYQILKEVDYSNFATGSAQPLITQSSVKALKFSCPDLESIDLYSSKIEMLYNKRNENLTENQTLTQLRDTLLPQLISGAVRLKEFRE